MTAPPIDDLQAWQRVVGAAPDGHPGPDTFARTVAWLRAHGYIEAPAVPVEARQRIVREAVSCMGAWTAAQVDDLWREVGCPELAGHWHDKAWCGAFALRCIRRALELDWTWHEGKGFLEVYGLRHIALPEPGDVAYFAQAQHHAIVVGLVGDGRVQLANGNGMSAPAEGVMYTVRALTDATTYYSVAHVAG